MGLFDNLNDPVVQAKLMMAAGLLSPVRNKGWRGLAEATGQGLQQGLLGYTTGARTQEAVKRGEMERQLEQARLDQIKQAQEAQAYMGQGISKFLNPGTPSVPYNDSLGTGPQAPIPGQAPSFDQSGFASYLAQNPATAAQALQFMPRPEKPAFEKVGNALVQTNAPGGPKAVYQGQEDWQNPDWVRVQKDIRAAGKPVVNATTNVMPPREVFKDSLALKKDFDSVPEVKGFKEVRSAWDQISTALASPSAANDMAAATKFMKLLDPGSVVRESELAMAMQASGVLDRMANYHKRLMSGEKLTPSQREDFFSAGKALYEAAKGRYDETVNQYEGIAKQYNLDPTFIYRGKDRLSKNSTATMRAKQAIKGGAPREQVIKRLVEEGFDPEGL